MKYREIYHNGPPQGLSQPNPYWLNRGLVSLYAFNGPHWNLNQVTGKTGGASTQGSMAVSALGDRIRLTGSGKLRVKHLLPVPLPAKLTFICGMVTELAIFDVATTSENGAGLMISESTGINFTYYDGWSSEEYGIIQAGSKTFVHSHYGALQAILVTDKDVASTYGGSYLSIGGADMDVVQLGSPFSGKSEYTFFAAIHDYITTEEARTLIRNPGLLWAPRPRHRIRMPDAAPFVPTPYYRNFASHLAQ